MSKTEYEKSIREVGWDEDCIFTALHGHDIGFCHGYREGIKAAIDMLRSENAENKNEVGLGSMEPEDWADWLEQQFKEELNK